MAEQEPLPGAPAPSSTDRLATLLEPIAPELITYLKRLTSEHRAAQNWSTIKRAGLAIAFVLGLSMWLFGYGTILGVQPSVIKPVVAQIDITGPIGEGSLASADRLVPLIAEVCGQSLVKGLVLHINSPGGAPGDAERIGAAIDACRTPPRDDKGRAAPNRKIVAVIDGLGASAAYMIAIHADRIVANPTGMVGSIGIIIEGLKFDGLMSKVGVNGYAYASGPLKTMLSPYSADTAAQARVAQDLADAAMQAFKKDVLHHRHDLQTDTPDLWSGRVWVAEQAKTMGLIDDVGLLEPTEKSMFPSLPVQRFAPQRNVRDALSMGSFTDALIQSVVARQVSVH